jgi:translation initiation factor 1
MEKKGRRGKTVTRIAGLPQRDLNALAVEMKKALGCGAMVEESEVVLQGSLVERAAAWLSKQGAKQVVKGN